MNEVRKETDSMGVVEVPEGLRVITRVDVADEAELVFGAPMRFTTVELPTGEPSGADGSPDTLVTWSVTPC